MPFYCLCDYILSFLCVQRDYRIMYGENWQLGVAFAYLFRYFLNNNVRLENDIDEADAQSYVKMESLYY